MNKKIKGIVIMAICTLFVITAFSSADKTENIIQNYISENSIEDETQKISTSIDTVITQDEDWDGIGTGKLYPHNLTDWIGIGTNNPQKLLDIATKDSDYKGLGICLRSLLFGGTSWEINNDMGVFKIIEKAACTPKNYNNVRISLVGNCIGSPYNGNVGIGTESPQATLDIYDSDSAAEIRLDSGLFGGGGNIKFADSGWSIWSSFVAPPQLLSFRNGKNEVMTLRGENIGIGTTNPDYKLDVEGYVQAYGYYTGDIIFQKGDRKLWKMFEDENGLYLENIETGKVYTFVLHEQEDTEYLHQRIADLEARITTLENLLG